MAKLVPLGLFIILAFLAFRLDIFNADFSGIEFGVPVWEQVKDTMLITLWVFIGIEGAVVVSARAKPPRCWLSNNFRCEFCFNYLYSRYLTFSWDHAKS